MSENTLITGVTGFIGKAVARALSNSANGVVRGALRGHSARVPQGVEPIVVGELSGTTDWRAALAGIDCVIHLAGRVHMLRDGTNDPLAAYRSENVDATINLARQSAACGVRRLVFMSSVKVNGETTDGRSGFVETDATGSQAAPRDPYGRSKLEAERGLLEIASATGLEVVVIRPPLVYGPGVKANFAALVRAVNRGIPIPLGAVDNRRSLIGLDNLVDFVLICLRHPSAANEIFLVSDGEDLSTPDLIRRLAVAMGRPARLIPVPTWLLATAARLVGKQDVARRLIGSLCVDSSKARTILGWTPPLGVDEGLRRVAAPIPRASHR